MIVRRRTVQPPVASSLYDMFTGAPRRLRLDRPAGGRDLGIPDS